MLDQRELVTKEVLLRILKTDSPIACKICKKLNRNVENITALSENEFREMWEHIKTTLIEAQELYKKPQNKNCKYKKECSLTLKLVRTVTAIGLQTILQRILVPDVMLESVTILHSLMLPDIKDDQVKDEISYFFEKWWELDITRKENIVENALKYLIRACESSLQHVKRLYDLKSAIVLLKHTEDVQEVLQLVQKNTVMSLKEGRLLILHLFTFGEQYVLGIHKNIKVMLQTPECDFIAEYGDLYAGAWLNATGKLKTVIEQHCLQDIIFHCFRAFRDYTGRGYLGKNLLALLAALQNNKYQAVRKLICNQCKPMLWEHLKAPGSYIRCNAAEILFIVNPVQYTRSIKTKSRIPQKYYCAMADLLKDPNYQVCSITMNGVFDILENHWTVISNDIIQEWLQILLKLSSNSRNLEIRIAVFAGLKQVMNNKDSHATFKEFLPNFANNIYDVNIAVVKKLIELVWHAQKHAKIPFWEVIPITYILDRLMTIQDPNLLSQLIKLVWTHIYSNDMEVSNIGRKIAYIGRNNINAVRKFSFHSKSVINWSMSLKLIKAILSVIQREVECSSGVKVPQGRRRKRTKTINKENQQDNVTATRDLENEDFDESQHLHVLVEVIALLLATNAENVDYEKLNEEETNVLQTIAKSLPEFLNYFKDTPVNESVIFLYSIFPPKLFSDEIEIVETLLTDLCNPEVTDDVLLTVLYVLMKWEKGETILSALTKLFTESISVNTENTEGNSNNLNILEVREKELELSLRILKHLLHVEHQSVLMNKYHQDVTKFCRTLHLLRRLIEQKLNDQCTFNCLLSEELLIDFFNVYASTAVLLPNTNTFDVSVYFSEIIMWVQRAVVPHIPDIDAVDNNQIASRIIKDTFDISNQLLKQHQGSPKLCCDIVLLYSNCMSRSGGIIFMNKVFDAMIVLLEFSKFAYENGEINLLSIVVPNFFCATMTTLTRHTEDIIIKYTDNLQTLAALTQKYSSVIENTCNSREMYLSYITVMLNAAVSSISTEVTTVLQKTSIAAEHILHGKYPLLAEKILKISLRTKKFQEFSVQVLAKTITNYSQIDMLSALLITYRMLKSENKIPVNSLKNLTLAAKLHNQSRPFNTPHNRCTDAMNIVIQAILQQ